MRILIVGGTSSLAQALRPILSEFAEVVTAGRTGCDVRIDLTARVEKIELPKDIDVVVNAAANYGGNSIEEMLQAENVNVLGTVKLCHACTKAKIMHLIQISSIFACLDKSSPFYSMYSLSKKHAEEVAQLYCSRYALPLTILRPSQFYGVGDAYRKHQPFLYSIIDKAANDEDILIYGKNDALRNFIHVEDVAKIIALVIQRKIKGTYACINTENVRYSEVAAAAIESFGSTSTVRFIKEQPDIPNNIFELDDSLYHLIDYYPQISISLGMKKEAAFRKITE